MSATNPREEKVKQLRIIEIDKMIRSGSFPSVSAMQKRFEVSRATIMRDLEFLRDRYDAPLEYDAEKRGYHYTDPTFFIQSVMLSESELFSVSVIQPLLEQYRNTPLESSIKNIFTKVTDMLPAEVAVDTYFLAGDVSFIADPLPHIEPAVFESVFRAIRIRHTLTFGYRTIQSQDYAPRTFNPYRVICQKGNWYVIGQNVESQKIRVYTLSRMNDVAVTECAFNIPADFKIEDHIDLSFGIWNSDGEPQKIELEFDKGVSTYILERDWHKNQCIRANEDGTVYLSFETNQMEECLHWVMGFCGSVKVLNPKELRNRVQKAAEKILSR